MDISSASICSHLQHFSLKPFGWSTGENRTGGYNAKPPTQIVSLKRWVMRTDDRPVILPQLFDLSFCHTPTSLPTPLPTLQPLFSITHPTFFHPHPVPSVEIPNASGSKFCGHVVITPGHQDASVRRAVFAPVTPVFVFGVDGGGAKRNPGRAFRQIIIFGGWGGGWGWNFSRRSQHARSCSIFTGSGWNSGHRLFA